MSSRRTTDPASPSVCSEPGARWAVGSAGTACAEDFAGRLAHARAVGGFRADRRRDAADLRGIRRGSESVHRASPGGIPGGVRAAFHRIRRLGQGCRDPVDVAGEPVARARWTTSRQSNPDDGSNAWAFAPSRTTSGKAILLRNPHLAWTAGYYEAHLTVPGVLDFYGDLGSADPSRVIGGFNRDLGWATTNNDPTPFADLRARSRQHAHPDRYWLDGDWKQFQKQIVTRGVQGWIGLRRRRRASSCERRSVQCSVGEAIRLRSPHGQRRGVPGRRAVPAHDASAFARRVEGRDAHARPRQLELHLRRPRREHLLPVECVASRRCRIRAAATASRFRFGVRATRGAHTSRSIRCRKC